MRGGDKEQRTVQVPIFQRFPWHHLWHNSLMDQVRIDFVQTFGAAERLVCLWAFQELMKVTIVSLSMSLLLLVRRGKTHLQGEIRVFQNFRKLPNKNYERYKHFCCCWDFFTLNQKVFMLLCWSTSIYTLICCHFIEVLQYILLSVATLLEYFNVYCPSLDFIGVLQHVFHLLPGKRASDTRFLATFSPTFVVIVPKAPVILGFGVPRTEDHFVLSLPPSQ